MSASIALSSVAVSQSAAATAQAAAAKKVACMKYVQGFQNDTANTAEMRQYASCVNTLHPEPLSDGATWVVKVAILIVFAGMIAGGIKGHTDSWGDFGDRYVLMPLFGAFAAAGGLLVLGCVVAGVAFLLS
jgi:hypothetical protein